MHEESRSRIRTIVWIAVLALIATGAWSIALQAKNSAGSFQWVAGKRPASWKDVAGTPRRIDLRYPDAAEGLLALTFILVDPAGNLIIPDGTSGRILVFDPSGRLIREIARKGQGPGEFNILSHASLDPQGRLVAYDVDGHRFSIFSAGTYDLAGSFQTVSPVTEIAALRGGTAIYSPYNDQVIAKLDTQGRVVQKALAARRGKLRLFLCRFQNGGIVEDGEGGVFGVYPESFAIYHFDKDLNLISRLDGGSSEWRPDSPAFPESLSPYGYTPAHLRWWDSHLHVDDIYNVAPNLLAVTLYKSDGPTSRGWYLNLYTKTGEILAEGLSIPDQGRIVATKDCKLWVARNAYLKDDGQVAPYELLEYSLRGGSAKVASFCTTPPERVSEAR
jgi:hypothetical protein